MIKLGMCSGIDNINKVAAAGYDYLEAGFSTIARMSDEEFARALEIVKAAPIKVEACNGMMPGDIRVTGPDVNTQAIHDFLNIGFERAAQLGVKVVVFGSSASRRVPEGFDTAQAWRQINNFLRLCEGHCAKYDITVVIEPLRVVESNIMNYVSEATLMSALVNMPHIAVLADTYHMAMGNEPLSALTMAGSLLKHVHVANALGRLCPRLGDGERYQEIFDTLRGIGYEGRVSIEGRLTDFDSDIVAGFECLNTYR